MQKVVYVDWCFISVALQKLSQLDIVGWNGEMERKRISYSNNAIQPTRCLFCKYNNSNTKQGPASRCRDFSELPTVCD